MTVPAARARRPALSLLMRGATSADEPLDAELIDGSLGELGQGAQELTGSLLTTQIARGGCSLPLAQSTATSRASSCSQPTRSARSG
jgi:hypothetical protein